MIRHNGFTLIEVLIALMILSIALTAIMKASSQNIRHTRYIENKTVAHWVGLQIINEARTGIRKIPPNTESIHETTRMLGESWPWEISTSPTPNPHIVQIKVYVRSKEEGPVLAQLTSYLLSDQPA